VQIQQDFAPGGLGEISPNKASKWRQNQNAILILYGHLPCLARLAKRPKGSTTATALPLHFSDAKFCYHAILIAICYFNKVKPI